MTFSPGIYGAIVEVLVDEHLPVPLYPPLAWNLVDVPCGCLGGGYTVFWEPFSSKFDLEPSTNDNELFLTFFFLLLRDKNDDDDYIPTYWSLKIELHYYRDLVLRYTVRGQTHFSTEPEESRAQCNSSRKSHCTRHEKYTNGERRLQLELRTWHHTDDYYLLRQRFSQHSIKQQIFISSRRI